MQYFTEILIIKILLKPRNTSLMFKPKQSGGEKKRHNRLIFQNVAIVYINTFLSLLSLIKCT